MYVLDKRITGVVEKKRKKKKKKKKLFNSFEDLKDL